MTSFRFPVLVFVLRFRVRVWVRVRFRVRVRVRFRVRVRVSGNTFSVNVHSGKWTRSKKTAQLDHVKYYILVRQQTLQTNWWPCYGRTNCTSYGRCNHESCQWQSNWPDTPGPSSKRFAVLSMIVCHFTGRLLPKCNALQCLYIYSLFTWSK